MAHLSNFVEIDTHHFSFYYEERREQREFPDPKDRGILSRFSLQRKQVRLQINPHTRKRGDYPMEENHYDGEERLGDQAKTWVQENLRVIVSIFIVAAIALGIYSYSQRSEDTLKDSETVALTDEVADEMMTEDTEDSVTTDESATTQKVAERPAETSQETASAFVETAVRGDGSTHLARAALMHYLEKTPDSSLTGAHKVYIEDYLRKQVAGNKHLAVGQSLEFSKDMIRQAIDQSQKLTDSQLKNLSKYAQRVSAYRS